MVSYTIREVVMSGEDPAYYQHQKEENTIIDKQSFEYIDEFCTNKPESIAVVKEPIDYISSGIQSRLQLVSNLNEDDEVEPTSTKKAGVECANIESESKVSVYR